jgi:hypothetical protein
MTVSARGLGCSCVGGSPTCSPVPPRPPAPALGTISGHQETVLLRRSSTPAASPCVVWQCGGFWQWGGLVAPYATCGHDVWAYRGALQCLPCPALTFSADCRPPSCPQCESWGWTGRSADCRRDWARAGTGLLPCGPLCPCASWSPPDTCHPALGVRCVLRVRGGGCGTCGGRLCCGFGAHSSA